MSHPHNDYDIFLQCQFYVTVPVAFPRIYEIINYMEMKEKIANGTIENLDAARQYCLIIMFR